MVARIKLTADEWERIKSGHEELEDKPNHERIQIEYEQVPFMHRTQRVKVWVLISLVVFALIGGGWVGEQVYLHYKAVLLGLGFMAALIVGVKMAKEDKRRK